MTYASATHQTLSGATEWDLRVIGEGTLYRARVEWRGNCALSSRLPKRSNAVSDNLVQSWSAIASDQRSPVAM